MPYDDYDLQGTIGGLGAIDPNTYYAEDWGDSGLGGAGTGTGGNLESATMPPMPPPPMATYSGGRPLSTPSPGIEQAMRVLAAGQQAQPLTGLFGSPTPPTVRAQPQPTLPEPKGSQTAQQVVRTLSQPRSRQTAVAQPPPANPPGRKPPTGNAPAPYRGPSWDYQGIRTATGPSAAAMTRNTSPSTAQNVVRNTTKRF